MLFRELTNGSCFTCPISPNCPRLGAVIGVAKKRRHFLEGFEMKKSVALLTAITGSSVAHGELLTIDIAGIQVMDELGSDLNTVLAYDLGDVVITGVGWSNLVASGFNGSWGREIHIEVAGVFPIVAFGGEAWNSEGEVWGPSNSFGGITNLDEVGIGSIALEAAPFELEFYDSFDNGSGPEAEFLSGTIFIEYSVVPAPGAFALLGLASLGRRRRS